MDAPPSRPSLKSAAIALALLLGGLLAFALWPQEFRYDRQTPGGVERVAVYTRWGFVVKEVVLEGAGTPTRSRTFPVGEVGLWRMGTLEEIQGGWEPTGP